jgi:hypothetical protein
MGLRLRAVQINGLRRRASRVARGLETRVVAPVSSRRIERWIEDCEPLLRTSARRRNVVILASTRQRGAVLACVRRFKGDRILVLGVRLPPMPGVASREAGDLEVIYDEIRQFGAANVMIDLRPVDVTAHRELWELLIFQLAHGGVFVATRRGAPRRGAAAGVGKWGGARR